jgi:MOSC domain-containing protein YiiM
MTEGEVVGLHAGLPAEHAPDAISDKPFRSGIAKAAVSGRLWLDTLNFKGDGQADLQNHGGPFRAVLAYCAEHYPVWRAELDNPALAYGAFGENLTVTAFDEDSVCLGDIFAVGETRLQVAQPRRPCWKLARYNGLHDLAARVEEKGWGGWYHRVLQTGHVAVGDRYALLERPYPALTIRLVNETLDGRSDADGRSNDADIRAALVSNEALSPQWREHLARPPRTPD